MPKKEVLKSLKPYAPPLIEKAEVEIKPIRFPKDLGEEHPFSFKLCEETYCKIGMGKAIIDKHIDFIVSPGFFIKSKDKKAEVIINDFIRNIGFEGLLRDWIQEALIKGNGFFEISKNKNTLNLQSINANNMYIQRNKKGEIEGYNQYVGEFDKFNRTKVIPFREDEIAHLAINKVGDCPYGFGITYPMLITLDNLAKSEKDAHMLQSRKANSPIVAYVGTLDSPPTQSDIDDTGQKFEHLNNYHEWAFPYTTKLEALNFGDIGEKFSFILEHDIETLFYIGQIPAVLMGKANVPEGLAKVQMDAFERRIKSLQARIEKVIEEKIFGPILEMNGFDIMNPSMHVEFEWGQPSEIKINERIAQLTILMQNPLLSPQLRAAIELDIAEQLGYEEALDVLPPPAEAPEIERDKEEELEQPEVPGEKEKYSLSESIDMKLNEWLNFDYQEYEIEVLKFIQADSFDSLRAKKRGDLSLGLLSKNQIGQLKEVLYDGFENNKSIRELSDEIKKLNLKDRYVLNNDGKKLLHLSKEDRPIMIARSESTRVASEGVLNHYSNQEIKEVSWLASISERTCPFCLSQNGRIFNLNEARGQIPAHSMCRCTWISIKE